jgi:cell division protein ZapA
MANVSIKFNNKDYLLSCDEGQEQSLKKLTNFLDKKHNELKDQLGNIGENKLLLITTIKIIDDYFNLKQKVDTQKNKINEISKKFLEMKSLAIKYKENKDIEINNLTIEIDKLKVTIEESNFLYESVLDKTTKSLQDLVTNVELKSELQ